jgi:hypothetical protein
MKKVPDMNDRTDTTVTELQMFTRVELKKYTAQERATNLRMGPGFW